MSGAFPCHGAATTGVAVPLVGRGVASPDWSPEIPWLGMLIICCWHANCIEPSLLIICPCAGIAMPGCGMQANCMDPSAACCPDHIPIEGTIPLPQANCMDPSLPAGPWTVAHMPMAGCIGPLQPKGHAGKLGTGCACTVGCIQPAWGEPGGIGGIANAPICPGMGGAAP